MRHLIAAASTLALGLVAVPAAIPAAHAADMPVPPPYIEGEAAPPPAYAPPPQAYPAPPPAVVIYGYPPPPPVAYAPPPPPPDAYYAYDDEDAPYVAAPGPYYGYGYWRGYGPRFAYGYGRWGHSGHWHYRH